MFCIVRFSVARGGSEEGERRPGAITLETASGIIRLMEKNVKHTFTTVNSPPQPLRM